MATVQNLQFPWDAVDQLLDLERLRLILEALPDEALLAARCRDFRADRGLDNGLLKERLWDT